MEGIEKLYELSKIVHALSNLCRDAPEIARKLPQKMADTATGNISETFTSKEVKAEIVDQCRKKGEELCARKLLACSIEIEHLRAALCSMAASAAIEAGVIARQLADEAKGGQADA